MLSQYAVIHAHFYQPPRENPWLGEVEEEPSAYPFHNWNQRVTRECYLVNIASRVLESGKIKEIINNYEKISFNFGPTLLSWMEKHSKELYSAVIEADRRSARDRHGNAIAQVYNHSIMPLNSKRDKETQVEWGIKDFEYRFGRKPEGIWLAETAVDKETLSIVAGQGIKFVILAPGQAKAVRRLDARQEWQPVNNGEGEPVDTTKPYLFKTGENSSITLFFYDGALSHKIAFGNALEDGVKMGTAFIKKAEEITNNRSLVHIATDGETFGHHHKFGEMALSSAIKTIEGSDNLTLTNYGQYLSLYQPVMEADIWENSSWSCAHGVERWRSDCGCSVGSGDGWNQKWRTPLRNGLNQLKNSIDEIFESEGLKYFKDPWSARNSYIDVLLDEGESEAFIKAHALSNIDKKDMPLALQLMEMQSLAMKMFTSCGWFFSDISGIETVQIMKYAAKAIELASLFSPKDIESSFIAELAKAKSNLPDLGTGAKIYKNSVSPHRFDPERLSVKATFEKNINSLFTDTSKDDYHILLKELLKESEIYGFSFNVGKASESFAGYVASKFKTDSLEKIISSLPSILSLVKVFKESGVEFNSWDIENHLYPYYIAYKEEADPMHTDVAENEEFLELFKLFNFLI